MAPWNLDGLHTGLVIAYVIDDRIRTHPKIPLDHSNPQEISDSATFLSSMSCSAK